MIRVSSFRFFLVVAPPPPWLRIALCATVIAGCATVWLNPGDVDSAFGGILLLQMFGVSGGYAASAARGHFDPLLVGHGNRRVVALGHFLASAVPGALAWAAVVVVASMRGHLGDAAALNRLGALLVVSCWAWAAGLALPRLAAGAIWSLLLVALATSRTAANYLLVVQAPPVSWDQVASAAAACAVCPFLLLSRFPGALDPRVLATVGILCFAALEAGVEYIARRDYGLMEPA